MSHIDSLQDTQINAAKYFATLPKQRKPDKMTKVATKHLEDPEFPDEEDINGPPPSYILVSKSYIKSEPSIYSEASVSGKTLRSEAQKQEEYMDRVQVHERNAIYSAQDKGVCPNLKLQK